MSVADDQTRIDLARHLHHLAERLDDFDEFMEVKAQEADAKWLNARIAGTSHRNGDGTSRQKAIRDLAPFEKLELRREPDNKFSATAVAIHDSIGQQVGYVPDFLSRDIAAAIDSGGEVGAFVRDVRESGARNWGVAIGIYWRAKLSPRNEFRRMLDKRFGDDMEEWRWAKLTGLNKINPDGTARQELIASLQPLDILEVRCDGTLDSATKAHLVNSAGSNIASFSKQESADVLAGMRDGRAWTAIVFEVRPRAREKGIEPVVALILLRPSASSSQAPHDITPSDSRD